MVEFAVAMVMLVASLGLVGTLGALLNARDRRAAELVDRAAAQFSPRALRSDVVIHASARLLSHRARVRIGLGDWADEATRQAAAGLRRALPPSVELEVDGVLPVPSRDRIRVDAGAARAAVVSRGPGAPALDAGRRAV